MENEIKLKDKNNIIQFPGIVVREIPKNEEEIVQRVDNIKHLHVQEVLSTMIPIIFNQMATAGFDFIDDEEINEVNNVKDGAFLVEALRSIMLKHYEIEHPIQILAENLFNEDKDSGVLFLKHDVISAMFEIQQEKS
tara:strand:+ start:1072 stop:1482 length:411 start_codon:yes stop_codon:yes gene_type:complete